MARGGGARRGSGPAARGGAAAQLREHEEDGSSLGACGSSLGEEDPDGAEERQRWRRPPCGWAWRACPRAFYLFLFFLFD